MVLIEFDLVSMSVDQNYCALSSNNKVVLYDAENERAIHEFRLLNVSALVQIKINRKGDLLMYCGKEEYGIISLRHKKPIYRRKPEGQTTFTAFSCSIDEKQFVFADSAGGLSIRNFKGASSSSWALPKLGTALFVSRG